MMMKFAMTVVAFAALISSADAGKKKRRRQRARAEALLLELQSEAFPGYEWLEIGRGCCRTSANGLRPNEESATCGAYGDEESMNKSTTITVDSKGKCRKACDAASCCLAWEYRPRANSWNCDLYNTEVLPNACDDGPLLCKDAHCFKKNLGDSAFVKKTDYDNILPGGCCRGNNLTSIASLPILDNNKRKKHIKNCQRICDLTQGCSGVESSWADNFAGGCVLQSGEATTSDNTPVSCRETNCFHKQCPGSLQAIVDSVPLSNLEPEKTAASESREGTIEVKSSSDSEEVTTVLAAAGGICLVVGMMGVVVYKLTSPTSLPQTQINFDKSIASSEAGGRKLGLGELDTSSETETEEQVPI